MPRMMSAFTQDIDPKTVAVQSRCPEIPISRFRKLMRKIIELLDQLRKGGRSHREVIQGGIGCVTGIAFSLTPIMASLIAVFDHPAGVEEVVEQSARGKTRLLDMACEECSLGHAVVLSWNFLVTISAHRDQVGRAVSQRSRLCFLLALWRRVWSEYFTDRSVVRRRPWRRPGLQ